MSETNLMKRRIYIKGGLASAARLREACQERAGAEAWCSATELGWWLRAYVEEQTKGEA